MILCITPHPGIDRTLVLPNLVLGDVHRAQKIMVAAGGQGLNVARTIRTLGREPLCMGFADCWQTQHKMRVQVHSGHEPTLKHTAAPFLYRKVVIPL